MAARRRHPGEARHGHRAQRSARDDGAWRQGPGSADRDPRRHDDGAEGPARAAHAVAPGGESGARHARPARVGRTQGRRSRAGRGGTRSRGTRGRGRAPPPALRRDDARGGSARDRGLARREPHPGGLLVRARQRCAQAGRGRRGDRRGRGLALAQGRAGDDGDRACLRFAGDAPRRAGVAASDGAVRRPARRARSRPRSRSAPQRPTRRRLRAGGSCTGCCRRCPRCRRSSAPRRRADLSRARRSAPRKATPFSARS